MFKTFLEVGSGLWLSDRAVGSYTRGAPFGPQSSAYFYKEHLFPVLNWNDKNNEKEVGNDPILKYFGANLDFRKNNFLNEIGSCWL